MHARTLPACLALCALLAAAGCEDRRDTHPPDESRAADSVMQPADAGQVTRPPDQGTADQRCEGLDGQALRDCTQQAGTDDTQASPPIRP